MEGFDFCPNFPLLVLGFEDIPKFFRGKLNPSHIIKRPDGGPPFLLRPGGGMMALGFHFAQKQLLNLFPGLGPTTQDPGLKVGWGPKLALKFSIFRKISSKAPLKNGGDGT
ncbi:MAG: hypothetical protein CM15mP88_0220 [Pseudomonadota bacterium]|nr:MAG: hypothetical protein CM15mP88_0220 [Pseudomonadota bacterium]